MPACGNGSISFIGRRCAVCKRSRSRTSRLTGTRRKFEAINIVLDTQQKICYSSNSMARQLKLALPEWGGKRKGAGRPRTRAHPGLEGPGVPHLERPELNPRHPVHVTLRVQPGIGYLRAQRRTAVILEALEAANQREDFQVVDYVILGNHLHLIVEADDEIALSRGMQALGIRIAMRLNRLQNRRGAVFVDRYHAHALGSRREVANALRYLESN